MADKKGYITIVGLGAMGGSYALGLLGKGYHVAGIDREQRVIDYALKHGMIDEGVASGPVDSSLSALNVAGVRKVLGQADAIILGVYPGRILPWLRVYRGLFKQNVLVTDMAGVKTSFLDEAQELMPPGCEFIASHPMVGIEKPGIENADISRFSTSNFLVVPTRQNTRKGVSFAYNLGKLLGFQTITPLDVGDHDRLVGMASHLPHMLAIALMLISGKDDFRNIASTSYNHFAYIANTNPELWNEIFLANTPVLARQIGDYIDCLQDIRRRLANDDREGLKAMLQSSSQASRLFLGDLPGEETEGEN